MWAVLIFDLSVECTRYFFQRSAYWKMKAIAMEIIEDDHLAELIGCCNMMYI